MNHPYGSGTPTPQQNQFNQRGHYGAQQQFGQNTGYAPNNDLYATQMQMLQQQQQLQNYMNGYNNNNQGTTTSPAPNVLGQQQQRDSFSNPSPSGRVVINPQQQQSQQLQQLLSQQQTPNQGYSSNQQNQLFGGQNQGFLTQQQQPMNQIQQAQQSYNIIGGGQGYGNSQGGPVMNAMLNTNMSAGVQRNNSFSVDQIKTVQLLIEQCLKSYLSQAETISCLCRHIEPGFINLMWQKLEQQNPEFFKAYNIRIKIKDQINIFNDLVNEQAQMMKQEGVLVQNNATPTTPTTTQQPNQQPSMKNSYGRQSTTPSPSSQSPVFDNRRGSTTINSNANVPQPNHLRQDGLVPPNGPMQNPMFGKQVKPEKELMSMLQEKNVVGRQQQQFQELRDFNTQLMSSLSGSTSLANQLRRSDSMQPDNQDLVQQHQILMQQIHQLQQTSNNDQNQHNQPPQMPPQQAPIQHQPVPPPIQSQYGQPQGLGQHQNVMTSPTSYLSNVGLGMGSPPFSMRNNNESQIESTSGEIYGDDGLGFNTEVSSLFSDNLEDYNNPDINGFFLDDDK